jgi:mono/diheme cytochrome c family protein
MSGGSPRLEKTLVFRRWLRETKVMASKLPKLLGGLVVVALLAIAGLVIYVKVALPNVGPAPDLKVEATPAQLARGRYLATHVTVCIDCHSTRDWNKFAGPVLSGSLGKGGELFDQKVGFPGAFVAANITPAGIAAYSDGELFRLITTGVTRDGRAIFPVMPYQFYSKMDPEDIHSIIAYVRSLPPVENHPAPSKADFPLNLILNTIPKKAEPGRLPAASDTVAYGRYLANASACAECHTKQEKGKIVGEYLAGGFEFNLGNGRVVRSANLTPHENGLKAMTRDQFIQRFKVYASGSFVPPPVDMAKGEFQTVMPWLMYAGMTEQDLGAIYDYLRTVPVSAAKVEKWGSVN